MHYCLFLSLLESEARDKNYIGNNLGVQAQGMGSEGK